MPHGRTTCRRCISDTSISDIRFDDSGQCQYCTMHDEMESEYPQSRQSADLQTLVEHIKKAGRGKSHDCVIGLSGGTDSSYTLLKVLELGLRPVAVHLDNGWNSEIAQKNIENAVRKLKVDFSTYVVNWEEFKDLQIAFLKAGVPDLEVPTDVAIHAVLVKTAAENGLKYVLNGHSFRTEGISPRCWTYMDARYIRAIQKRFGTRRLQSFPNFSIFDFLRHNIVGGIRVVPLLNYFDYRKDQVRKVLETQLDWRYYGGHHHESQYTRFIQSNLLPQKFGIDKALIELSAMVRSGHISRDAALAEFEANSPEVDSALNDYVRNKFAFSEADFRTILNTPAKSFQDYPSYYPLILRAKPLIRLLSKMGVIPRLLYLKFLG